MKILISSHAFYPSIGGIESASDLLAREFAGAGHEVCIVTQSAGSDPAEGPFKVFRNPGFRELLPLVRWCNVYWHNNISLQSARPLIALRKPWVITHQTWISRLDRSLSWQDHLKRFLLRYATNVSISDAVAKTLPVASVRIGNPFCDKIFRIIPGIARDRHLVFLGRLVSDKGADLLLQALARLRDGGCIAQLTIIGSGPEEPVLRNLVGQMALTEQVQFAGPQSGEALVQLLNRHRIMVVPSRWEEPFGIVALEGIASGCVVVGSSGGGLPEAIGPCGVTFPNGDCTILAERLHQLLSDGHEIERLRNAAPAHLLKFTARGVAEAYLALFDRLLR